jgi:hypothetical protein
MSDPIRAEIDRLERSLTFSPPAWERVFADLRAHGRLAGLADAERRMSTARENSLQFVGMDKVKCDGSITNVQEGVR